MKLLRIVRDLVRGEGRMMPRLLDLNKRMHTLENQMADQEKVSVPKAFIDDVTKLVNNVDDLGTRFEQMAGAVDNFRVVAVQSQTEIKGFLGQILARTSPVPDVDVADLVNHIGFAADRLAAESQKATDMTASITGFGNDVSDFAKSVADQAGIQAQQTAALPTPPPVTQVPDGNPPAAVAAAVPPITPASTDPVSVAGNTDGTEVTPPTPADDDKAADDNGSSDESGDGQKQAEA